MPNPFRRAARKLFLMRSARRGVSPEKARQRLSRTLGPAHQAIRENLNTSNSPQITRTQLGNISREKRRFALIEAFRAAHIFGNETRNEIVHLKKWSEIEKHLGRKRAAVFARVYRQAQQAAGEAEQRIFVRGEERVTKEPRTQRQLPVHGNLIQGKFRNTRKKAA